MQVFRLPLASTNLIFLTVDPQFGVDELQPEKQLQKYIIFQHKMYAFLAL
jgi:hypothetical protein